MSPPCLWLGPTGLLHCAIKAWIPTLTILRTHLLQMEQWCASGGLGRSQVVHQRQCGAMAIRSSCHASTHALQGSVTGGAPAPVRGHGHTQLLCMHAHPLLQGPDQLTGVTQVPDPNQSPSRPNCSPGTSPPRLLHVFREKACKPHLLPPVYPSRASCPVRCKAPNSSTQSHLFSPPTHTHLCVRVQRCSRGGPHALCMVEQHVEQEERAERGVSARDGGPRRAPDLRTQGRCAQEGGSEGA